MSVTTVRDLDRVLAGTPYQGYAYAYPHKTAYRPFEAPRPLRQLWADERRDALFLYLHVPFCEFRCGFCNLFTQANPRQGFVERYLQQLERQIERARDALGPASFSRFAIGGGTPTQLELPALARLLDLVEGSLGVDLQAVPVSVEMSPETVDPEKMTLLAERGVDRASLGVQSFVVDEARAAGRPQRAERVDQALEQIRAAGFGVLNVDLIYGIAGQTASSWAASLEAALAWRPEEVFLYPLYVRAQTGLGKRASGGGAQAVAGGPSPGTGGADLDGGPDDPRLGLYRQGRARLLEAGYEQVSMRLFRASHAPDLGGPSYCCQEDGMLGLGCGARSYTRSVHYADRFAVGAGGVREILEEWVAQAPERFDAAHHGMQLDGHEQRRRWVIQSLLHKMGLGLADYSARFGSQATDDVPELRELAPRGLAVEEGGVLRLTAAGLERSDALGPWLYSSRVRARMEAFELR
jgi:oxygen-independent coproporphyrinogen III oxidase